MLLRDWVNWLVPQVRNLDAEVNSLVYQPYPYFNHFTDFVPEPPQTVENTQPFPASPHYIRKAKAIVEKMTAGGGEYLPFF